MSLNVSIIVPTYNERENIVSLILEIKRYITSNDEIIVIDDDSPDKTWEIVHELIQSDASVKLIHRIFERGLTSAIVAGIAASDKDIVLWMDADFSMPPSKIPEMRKQVNGHDICIGSRYVKNGKDNRGLWLHGALSYMLNKLCYVILSHKVADWTSGFVCAKKSVFEKIALQGNYGEYCIDFLYRALKSGYSVKEIPYICINRVKGNSKTAISPFGFLQNGWRYIFVICKLKTTRFKTLK